MGVDAGLGATGHDADACDTAGRKSDGGVGRLPATSRARGLAQDWITLWQSELSALAADPEMRETWQTMIALWAGTMAASLRAMPRNWPPARDDKAARDTGAADAPRAAPAAAAPDPRDAEIERLARHVAALERRLADIERGSDHGVDPKRRSRRKP